MNPTALLLAMGIGVSLGLLGGGGSILTVPLLAWLGVPTREAITTSMVIVGATSLAATLHHARAGHVVWRTGGLFGAAGMVGAYVGARASAWVPEAVLLGLFGALMLATSIAMLRGRADVPVARPPIPTPSLLAYGIVFGMITGLLGAGGGFLIVPALTLFAGMGMAEAVGTSLLVITMNSFAGYFGASAHVTIDARLTAELVVAAVVGSQIGAVLASHVPAALLRRGFAVFVLLLGVIQLWSSVSGAVR